jgi:chromosome transmission fidelity protein 4
LTDPSENLVYIVDVNDRTNVQKIPTNDAPVRSAAWDPTGQYLVLAGCDGKLKVYDTSEKSPFNKRNLEGMIKSSQPDAQTQCYVAWHPSGDCFAVPTRTHDIALIARDTWSKLGSFHADGHREVVGELAWSPNGKYLASAAGSELLIWATEGKHVVTRCTAEAEVTGLAWAPNANMIAFTTSNGWFNRWTEPVSAEFASPFLSDADLAKKTDKLLDDDLFGDDEGIDLEEMGEEIGEEMGDDWLVDDDGAFAEDDAEDTRGGRIQVVNVTKAQPSFVPGATEWKAKKRYLAFNMIGVVDATDQETHNVVNVEFHDKGARRGYHDGEPGRAGHCLRRARGRQQCAFGCPLPPVRLVGEQRGLEGDAPGRRGCPEHRCRRTRERTRHSRRRDKQGIRALLHGVGCAALRLAPG